MMKLTQCLTLILSLFAFSTFAQLSIGDIAFVGYNTDSGPGPSTDHSFSFITLTDIPGSEVIFFTEEGWNDDSDVWGGSSEGHMEWTAPLAGIPCGTIIYITESGSDVFTVTGGGTATLESGSGWNLSGGDQVLAYQAASAEPATTPTFIAGLNGDDGNGAPVSLDPITMWNDPSTGALGTAKSGLPFGLTNGTDCVSLFVAVFTEQDNAKYTGTLTGTSTALRALINDRTNWSFDNSTAFDITPSAYSPSVTCVAPCTDPDIPTATSAPGTICDGNSALLTISGDKNDATAWHVYTGSCGGTLVATTAGSTVIVTPTPPSTEYFIRGEGGCVTPGSCGSITVTTTAREDASFSYDAAAYCADDSDPTPTITGVGGGTFTAAGGLSITASTGLIDVSASTPGTYTVTYTTGGLCAGDEDVTVTINALDDASFSYDAASYCANDSDPTPTITGLGGGTFSAGGGLSINASTGALDVSASTPGTYTVTYTTAGTCPNSSSVSVTINAVDDASFSYDAAAYCADDSDPTPTITGLAGGTFSSGGGLSINASTGAIDVSASTPGTYTVTYTTAGTCPNSSSVSVTVNALDDASFSYDAASYCVDDSDPTPTITGLGGGTFSAGGGLSINTSTGAIDVSASTPATYTVTYTTAGTCPNSSSVSVTINAVDDASFSYDAAAYCADDSDPTPTITGLAGGTFSSGGGLSINASTGAIDVSASTPGTYTITYTTAGSCPNSSSVSVTVNALDDASFSYDAAAYCVDDSDPTPTITGLGGGTFSAGGGLSINTSTGAIDVSTSTPGTYTVTYTTAGTCPNSSSVPVTVNALDDASFSYDAAAYCADDSDPTPTITGLAGGTFSSGGGLSINASTGAIDVSASTPGTYTITYTTAGSCPNSSSVSVTVNALDDASFSYDAAAYCVDDSDPTPTITGLGGGTFSAGGGLSINTSTGAIDVSASTPTTYTVTYTTAGTCPNSSSVSVTVNALDDASFSYDAAAYCADDSDPTPTITGLAGGTFSAGGGLSINTSTGAIDVSASTPGTYTVTYTTAGTCTNSSSVSVTVNALDDASFSYDAGSYCLSESDPTPTITGLAGGTFSSGAGLVINASTGEIDVSASTPGSYTVTYTTAGTCPNASSVSVSITALDDASFSYDAASYCIDDSDPTPTITGVGGGTFSAGGGLSINASTGAIDVSASTPGTYTVTYTTVGVCANSSDETVTINAIDDASFSYDAAAYCADDSDPTPTITGLAGGTFSAGGGLSINASTGAIDVSASTPGTYTVTYTTAGTCPNSSSVSVTVNALDDASFSYDAAAYCVDDSDPTPTITGLGGGTFSAGGGLSINTSTGAIDVSASTPGTYTVTYTTAGTCPNSSSVSVTVNALDDASFSYDAAAYCADDSDPTPTITGLAGGTFSSGGGLSINASTGAIDVSASTPGTYTITYTTAGSCPNSSSVSVTVNALDDASFSYDAAAYCVDDSDPTPTITGLGGGTFSAGGGLSINASTGAIDVSASTPGTYTVTYTTAGTCPNSSSVSVTVNALDDASFSYDAATYCADDSDPTPTITGLGGGTFSAGGGLSINTSTGAIDVSASTPGTYTVTYTTAGTCTNSSSVSVTVNALDDASFSYDSPSYCVSETDPTPTITGLGGGTFTSGAGLIIDASTGEIDVSASTVGSYTVTYSTAGSCPNSSSVSLSITALDDASFTYDASIYCPNGTDPTPTITGVPGGTFTSGAGLIINASTGEIDLDASTEGTYIVTYTTIGVCTNSSTETVTVEDDTDPEPADAVLADVTAECEVITLTDPVVTDNCGGIITITNDAILPITDQGTTVVTWTYEDENGNTTTQTQNIIIDDVTDPTPDLATLPDVTAECEVIALTDPTATDNCGGTVTVTNDAILPITDQGTTIVTWTYDDGNGNIVTQTQDIVIDDNTGPTPDVAILADITAECEVTALVDPTATDNCGGPVTVTNDAILPITVQGTTTFTWTYEDENGNTTSQSQDVVIDDVTFPTIIDCPADIAAVADTTDCSSQVFWTEPTFTDNCVGATMTSSHLPGDIFPSGTTTVTYTVTDVGLNETTCSFDIVVATDLTIIADITGEMFGGDGAIDVTVTGGTPLYTYDWDTDELDDFDDTEDLTGLDAGFYTLVVMDEYGCTVTEIIEVELECLPLTVEVSATELCENEELTLDATSESGADIIWDMGVIDGEPFIPSEAGIITYTATSESDEDCPYSIDIIILPAPTVVATAGDGNFCIGEPVVLAAGGDAESYTWDPTDLEPPVGITTYTLTGVFDETGCMNTATVDVTVHELPTVTASAELEVVCEGVHTALYGDGAVSYLWDPETISDGESFIPGPVGTYNYTVTGTDEFGCTNTAEIDITVVENISITADVISDSGLEDGEIDITVSGGAPPFSFDWDIDESDDFDDEEDLTDLSSGFYEVIVIDDAGCTNSTIVYVNSVAGITMFNEVTFKLYPNPAINDLTIEFAGQFDYELLSTDGKLILTGSGVDKENISIDGMADGSYIIVLRSDAGISRAQFIKH